ncbi:MAG TPA: alkaline phosphatase family protein [Acidimicrobiales bacterium]|nr:alkaline phosphatase family protein [Acidimicrobiales bacterium]
MGGGRAGRRGTVRHWGRSALAAAALAGGLTGAGALVPTGAAGPGVSAVALSTPVTHVFVIVLENESYASTFATTYYQQLAAQGALLEQYYGVGHVSNDNYAAMVSGQGPNPVNQGDCADYLDFVATGAANPDGQVPGLGCVYPAGVQTVGNQLTGAGLSFKDYAQDMGNIPQRDGTTATANGPACGHPLLDTPDITQVAVPGDGYATRHNPFVYFHSVIDDPAYCDAHVVSLGPTSGGPGLAQDLQSAATTPNLSFIVPNLCEDGHDPAVPVPGASSLPPVPGVNECTNESAPGGLAQTESFLHTWVPLITASPAYTSGGMLVITFDEASTSDSSSCGCNTGTDINSPEPGITGPGGGRVGAIVLSPDVAPGTVSAVHYDHYSLLATLEDLFGVGRLGLAHSATPFGPDVFTG